MRFGWKQDMRTEVKFPSALDILSLLLLLERSCRGLLSTGYRSTKRRLIRRLNTRTSLVSFDSSHTNIRASCVTRGMLCGTHTRWRDVDEGK